MTKYYSRSKQKFVDIEQMPDQYVRNAFVKMCKTEPTEDVIFAQQQSERADRSMNERNFLQEENQSLEVKAKHYKKLAEDNFVSSVADLDKIERLTQCNDKLQAMNDKLKDTTYQPYDKQGRVRDYQVEYTKLAKQRDSWKEKSMNMVEKSTYTELEMENVRLVAQLEHDEHNVGKLDDTVSKDTYQVMWDNCQVLQNERAKLLKESNELKESLRQANLTPTVSTKAYDIAWKNNEELKDQVQTLLDRNSVLSRMYNNSLSSNQKLEEDYKYVNNRMMNYATMINDRCPKGDVKMFSEIPNDPDGQEFVSQLKKYLNNVSYKIRVRGQYLNEETKKTEGWRKYERGQPIEKSKCLRVYIDVKKDVD